MVDKLLAEANQIIKDVSRQADRAIVSAGEARRLLALLRRSDKELGMRLGRAMRATGGPDVTFSQARLMATRAQVQAMVTVVQGRLLGETTRSARQAVQGGLKNAVRVVSAMERAKRGSAVTIRLEHAQVLDSLSRRRTGSLISQHEASVDRYGRSMVRKVERELMQGLVQGQTQGEMVDRLMNLKGDGLGPFEGEAWRARRIVRTETAYAYNVVQLDAIVEMRAEFPDAAKKIVATFDDRTAADSVYVHGQVRSIGEFFTDGAGRQYEHPPGRPNDREVLIPWRKSWPETEYTQARPPAEVAAAKVACLPESTPVLEKRATRRHALEQAKEDRDRTRKWRAQASRFYGSEMP